MSNLNPKQFEQLPMFVATEDLVDKYQKMDSKGYGTVVSPREQWEAVGMGMGNRESLRDRKLRHIDHGYPNKSYANPGEIIAQQHAEGEIEPLEIHAKTKGINDGHHRLAYAEREGIPYLPVTHF